MEAIKKIAVEGVEDPFLHPPTLARTVKIGILDTPHLQGLTVARGEIKTEIIEGKCFTFDKNIKDPIPEIDRINEILKYEGFKILKQ